MASTAALGPVVTAYRDRTTAVRSRVLAYVERTWGRLPAYRDADIARFVAAVVPVVAGGQAQTAALTDAYLAQVETAVLGRRARPLGIPAAAITTLAVRGVAPADVYRRPGVTVWTALAGGAPFPDAVAKGLDRALSIAATDVQLAKTHTARLVLDTKDHVVGYRRIVESGHPCALCVIAASQRYSRGDLMPIHGRCGCDVEPIYAEADPGDLNNPTDEEPAADRFGDDHPSAADVVVHDHGELGPVLAIRGQTFTGPDDL